MAITWLQIVWFILIAVLWTGYLVLEGFGIGSGMVMPLVAKTDSERAQVQRTFGPVWDGNEVWLLTAGGATFAAFPNWYATMFSGMYFALFLILLCLIVRVCAIEWRSKIASASWRARWDRWHSAVTWLVPILFGVAFANLVQGMRIEVVERTNPTKGIPLFAGATPADVDMSRYVHNLTGHGGLLNNGFLSLLTPYTILGGITLCLVFATQGLLWLSFRTDGQVQLRASALGKKLGVVTTVVVAVFALIGQFAYASQLLAWIPLIICALLLVAAVASSMAGRNFTAFLAHSLAIGAAVAWIFSAMAPNAMKSSLNPAYSLTITQASATQSTLLLMLIVAIPMVPIVLAYTVWAYTRMNMVVSIKDDPKSTGLPWNKIRLNAGFLAG